MSKQMTDEEIDAALRADDRRQRAAIEVARAEERERCAKACEKVGEDAGLLSEASVAWVCAEAIRQLGGGVCEN